MCDHAIADCCTQASTRAVAQEVSKLGLLMRLDPCGFVSSDMSAIVKCMVDPWGKSWGSMQKGAKALQAL